MQRHLLKAVVEDFWDNACQQRTADLQARVCVHLNQVQSEVFIDHEIVPEKLKMQLDVVVS